jgi:RNA methyltransferase, TrmH family
MLFVSFVKKNMLSKNRIKYITSLSMKKVRDAESVFVAEGIKLVLDLMPSFRCKYLFYTSEYAETFSKYRAEENEKIGSTEMERISFQKSPQGVLAVFYKKEAALDVSVLNENLSLALDDVQDPGNMGTIIRIADWFGIEHIFCSPHCADVYGNKTVQATMGALARVNIHYVDLPEFLKTAQNHTPVYGTFMNGSDIYRSDIAPNGIIVMGNEGNGISKEVEECVTDRLLIPAFPGNAATSESLNVGVATAIVCAEFRRRIR